MAGGDRGVHRSCSGAAGGSEGQAGAAERGEGLLEEDDGGGGSVRHDRDEPGAGLGVFSCCC